MSSREREKEREREGGRERSSYKDRKDVLVRNWIGVTESYLGK